ncbi:MAG: hypothetical protein EXQ84_02710 [Rhodospirillaceae bacterium]|nr:hypothetical protein [Rhodospirillaceae bacterium]
MTFFFGARGSAARQAVAEKAGLPPATAGLTEHASAKQFIATLGRGVFNDYYTFGFVRNPWDVAVSWFHYRLINPTIAGHAEAAAAGTFQKYVLQCLTQPDSQRLAGLQYPYLVDDAGQLAVSFIGRYVSLERDFATTIARLGISTLPLDHFNQSYHAAWPGLYTTETFGIVRALVAADAQLFGYSADPATYGIG